MTAVIGIPPAVSRGLDVRVLSTALQQRPGGEGGGVWVKSDSPLKQAQDLKGKTLGSYGLRSTGYTQVRFALQYKYGLNARPRRRRHQAGGDPGAQVAGRARGGADRCRRR